eukprot:scaffold10020_cov60-Cyclotella_meneghiniana.AAC.1
MLTTTTMNRLQMLLARLSPKHRLGSSYQSIITSCARNIITRTGNHDVAVRLEASSQIISCHSIARVWPSSVFDCPKTSEYVKIFSAGHPNLDLRGSVRFYRIEFRDCEAVDDVLHRALEQGQNLYPNHIAAMWTYIFRLVSKGQQQNVVHKEDVAQLELLIWDILEVTMDSVPRMRPRDLTTIILQLAKLTNRVSSRHYKKLSASDLALKNILLDEESSTQYSIFDPLAEAANQILVDFESRQLSNIAYAYSLLGYNPRIDDNTTLLENIADASLDCIQQFNAQDISNMMWAYTKLNVSHELLFQVVGDAIAIKNDLKTFKPQEIVNTVWAYATANVQHPNLFEKVGDEIATMDNLKSFNPQALSNTVWAYATANIQHPAMSKKVGDEIVAMDDLKSFKPQDYSNTVWAYATANIQHPALFKKVGDEIARMDYLNSFKPQELANTIWAYATANIQHPGLFKKVADEIAAMDDWESFDPQAIVNVVWAYATANVHHPDLFKKVGDEIATMDDLKSFNPQNLANVTWAYATANIQHPAMFKKVANEIVAMDDWESFTPQNLSTIAWAYTVANLDASSLFNSAFRQELLNRQNEFIGENLSQLYQWHLWQTKENSDDGLPDSLRDKCKQMFSSADTRSSALQKDVVSELTSIGLNPVEEYLTESGYSIDALVEINGKKVGIEVDGPSHFVGRQPKGHTFLKRRQVESIDQISLISVPYWEWNKLGKDRDKKRKYLQSILKST